MQSFEMTFEGQKRASTEAAAEVQKLRKERDHFKDSTERHERKVTQLRGIVRKAKDNETALKNAVAGLEASLQAANMERLDVLEGFHEACEQSRVLGKERDSFRDRLYYADPVWKETTTTDLKHSDQHRPDELLQRYPSLRRDTLLRQLDEVRQALSERNLQVQQLKQQITESSGVHQAPDRDKSKSSQDELSRCQQDLATAIADRDRYNSLLHTELRRQSRLAAQKAHAIAPQLETEALVAMRKRLNALKDTSSETDDPRDEGLPTSLLEKELEHCFKEIIMYKLDIKGYRKDLKSANAELEKVRSSKGRLELSNDETVKQANHDRATPVTAPTAASSIQDHSSGLGILMPPPPTTPQRNAGTSTPSAPSSANDVPRHPSATLSPPHRPKTPLGVHKKLPKPPPQSRTPSPYLSSSPPNAHMQRQETMRSLSESIISSYAKRSTPEQTTTSPPRGRSSDPPMMTNKPAENDEGNDARAVPMAKFTPRMLRTPTRAGAFSKFKNGAWPHVWLGFAGA
ncbi:hypothetical protein PRZ48_011552 [Zasmidium cellare]|uniref:Uncharacterized protein n=1 Tax=Zasmidium cellare TaxID=395010 RepID=A0ABR0E6P1_ZASCE|nr:hypothetical protein PRZ48_011552 [Zasmidium cellare]